MLLAYIMYPAAINGPRVFYIYEWARFLLRYRESSSHNSDMIYSTQKTNKEEVKLTQYKVNITQHL